MDISCSINSELFKGHYYELISQIRVFLTYVMHTMFQQSLVFYLLNLYLLNIFYELMDFISPFFKWALI